MCLLSTHQLSKLNFTEFLFKMFMKFVFDAQYDQLGTYDRKGRKKPFQILVQFGHWTFRGDLQTCSALQRGKILKCFSPLICFKLLHIWSNGTTFLQITTKVLISIFVFDRILEYCANQFPSLLVDLWGGKDHQIGETLHCISPLNSPAFADGLLVLFVLLLMRHGLNLLKICNLLNS